MTVRYLRLKSGDALPALDGFSPFKAVVVIEEAVSPEWQAAASRWLAGSGCLYMMAWGKDCESWDDSVDYAYIERFGYGANPDDEFIMTTWHEDEPLRDVMHYAKVAARHPAVELDHVLFLHIGHADRQAEFEALYRDA